MTEGAPLLPITDHWDWQLADACRSMDPDLFFSPAGERGVARRAREQRACEICAGCPVVDQCGRFALAHGEGFGVWGATTATERIGSERPGTSSTPRSRTVKRRPARGGGEKAPPR